MGNYQSKHITKAGAIKDAKLQSANNPNEIYYVIQSIGFYFVEVGTPFIRINEALIGEYLMGMKLKSK